MKNAALTIRCLAAALFAMTAQAAPAADFVAADEVAMSFVRMLGHEPYSGRTAVTVELGERDSVELYVHAMLRGEHDRMLVAER